MRAKLRRATSTWCSVQTSVRPASRAARQEAFASRPGAAPAPPLHVGLGLSGGRDVQALGAAHEQYAAQRGFQLAEPQREALELLSEGGFHRNPGVREGRSIGAGVAVHGGTAPRVARSGDLALRQGGIGVGGVRARRRLGFVRAAAQEQARDHVGGLRALQRVGVVQLGQRAVQPHHLVAQGADLVPQGRCGGCVVLAGRVEVGRREYAATGVSGAFAVSGLATWSTTT